MKKYKILIVSILAGSGHNSAADLLAQLLSKDERFEVIRYTNPSKMVDNSYNSMTKYSPVVHNFFVYHSPVITSDMINIGQINFVTDALEQLKIHQPDIVLSTHFTMSYSFKIAEWLMRKYPINICTQLDYGEQIGGSIPYNIFLRPEYYVTYNEDAWKSLKAMTGIAKDHLILSGHTCKKDFIEARKNYPTKKEALLALKEQFTTAPHNQLRTDKITVLIAGGGGGIIQKTYKLLQAIAKRQTKDISLIDKYQFIIICGQNQKYFEKIMKVRSTKLSWQNIFPFAWLDPKTYALIQRASDFPVLFGIAPATMHELLETECGPLMMHRVRADHELENVQFVADMKLGSYEPEIEPAVTQIFKPLSAERIEKFRVRARSLLDKELELLAELPDHIYKTTEKKYFNAAEIYTVSFKQRLASGFLVSLTVFVYYATKVLIWLDKLWHKFADFITGIKNRIFPPKN